MDKFSDLVESAHSKIGAESEHSEEQPLNPVIVELVNRLFGFFYSICRGFEKQYHDPKRLNMEKTQWILAFQDEGFKSKADIENGIKRTRRESPINTPTIGQFIDWCIPTNEAMAVPSLDSAYAEACKNSHPASDKVWTHKLVAHAWKLTGSYLLSNSPRSSSFPVFQRNYEISIREWRAGKPIAEIEIPLAINAPIKSEHSQELRKKAIADCLKMLKS